MGVSVVEVDRMRLGSTALREQKLSGVNDNEEGSVRLNRLNCDPIEGRVLESEKLIRKPPNELGIH